MATSSIASMLQSLESKSTAMTAVLFLFFHLCLFPTISVCHNPLQYYYSPMNFSSTEETRSGFTANHGVAESHKSSTARIHTDKNMRLQKNLTDVKAVRKCNIFTGSWVHDLSYPLYNSRTCPYMDGEVSCQKNGRPDTDYQKWKWKPSGCNLPRFNALYLLQKMRGKTIMFVGDSLARGQWESMICLLQSVLPQSRISYSSGDPLSSFKALDYGVTVFLYRAPYLVDMVTTQVKGEKKVVLRLDSININGGGWKGADVLVFNSGHWWTHNGNLRGWDYMQEGNTLYNDMDRTAAYTKGMSTWANWVASNIDTRRARVFFRSYSPSHTSPSEWRNTRGSNCYSESEPILGYSYPGPYPPLYKVAKDIVSTMKSQVYFMDITTLSLLRKDGHPSIYSSDFTTGERRNPARYADCSHWCLPGVPDTWNELLYSSLLFGF